MSYEHLCGIPAAPIAPILQKCQTYYLLLKIQIFLAFVSVCILYP